MGKLISDRDKRRRAAVDAGGGTGAWRGAVAIVHADGYGIGIAAAAEARTDFRKTRQFLEDQRTCPSLVGSCGCVCCPMQGRHTDRILHGDQSVSRKTSVRDAREENKEPRGDHGELNE